MGEPGPARHRGRGQPLRGLGADRHVVGGRRVGDGLGEHHRHRAELVGYLVTGLEQVRDRGIALRYLDAPQVARQAPEGAGDLDQLLRYLREPVVVCACGLRRGELGGELRRHREDRLHDVLEVFLARGVRLGGPVRQAVGLRPVLDGEAKADDGGGERDDGCADLDPADQPPFRLGRRRLDLRPERPTRGRGRPGWVRLPAGWRDPARRVRGPTWRRVEPVPLARGLTVALHVRPAVAEVDGRQCIDCGKGRARSDPSSGATCHPIMTGGRPSVATRPTRSDTGRGRCRTARMTGSRPGRAAPVIGGSHELHSDHRVRD